MIEEEIGRFVANRAIRNAWLSDENGKVYVRKARRFIQGASMVTFDIASIEANVCGKGFFKTVRYAVEKIECPVYVENVIEPRLESHLARNGYVMVSEDPPCFFKAGQTRLEMAW